MSDLSIAEEFFAPASTDMVDGLVSQYQQERQHIESVGEFIHGDGFGEVINYFLDGNTTPRERFVGTVAELFDVTGAVSALNSSYWRRTLDMTDVIDCMPAKRREEWFEQIEKRQTPDFEADTVRATLGELLAMRAQFLAERVDGIFRALSRTHVTNQPEGFSKRMIMTGVSDDWGSYSRDQTGHLNDLRAVIARLMKRDEPPWTASNRLVEVARRHHRGEWLSVDGSALRIRCYKNGNAHLEIHPDMAWQLNQILAHLHPMAIPGEYRQKPKRQRKHTLMDKPLPFAVLTLLGDMGSGQNGELYTRSIPHRNEAGKHVTAEAVRVLESIGGVRSHEERYYQRWEFDYDPAEVIRKIVVSGVVPDHKSHQFYPTPESLARQAIELADIQSHHTCLEPSAGTGALADMIEPRTHQRSDRVWCVEISNLHCSVLSAKGYAKVTRKDFLDIPTDWIAGPFDRIIMNPPFSEGRWQAHLKHALGFLKTGGKLVAILPASAKNSDALLPAFEWEISGPYNNQFAGASVSVVIAKATAPSGETA